MSNTDEIRNLLKYMGAKKYRNRERFGKITAKETRNSSGDEIANVNFFYVVHALKIY